MELKEFIIENKVIVAVVFLVAIAGLYQSGGLQFLFQGYQPSQLKIYQYAGEVDQDCQSWWKPHYYNWDMTSEIGDYKFEIEKADWYMVVDGKNCIKPSGYNLVQTGTDEFDCPLWSGDVITQNRYWTSNGNCGFYCRQGFYVEAKCVNPSSGFHPDTCYMTYYCEDKGKCGSTKYYDLHPEQTQYQENVGGAQHYGHYVQYDCGWITKIYKNGVLVESRGDEYPPLKWTQHSSFWYRNESIAAYIGITRKKCDQHCNSIWNEITIKIPEDKINISIEPLEPYYIQGQEAKARVSIQNNYRPMKVIVEAKVCQPTFFIPYCHTYKTIYDLSLGLNEIDYIIPSEFVTKKLEITPTVKLHLNINEFTLKGVNVPSDYMFNENMEKYYDLIGTNSYGDSRVDVEKSRTDGYVLMYVGDVVGNTTEVQIKPVITPPVHPGIWDKISDFFASIMIWISGLFW